MKYTVGRQSDVHHYDNFIFVNSKNNRLNQYYGFITNILQNNSQYYKNEFLKDSFKYYSNEKRTFKWYFTHSYYSMTY